MDAIAAPPTNLTPTNDLKPGWKTSEFRAMVLLTIGSILAQVAGFIPPPWGLIVGAIANAAYSISRGLAKGGQPMTRHRGCRDDLAATPLARPAVGA